MENHKRDLYNAFTVLVVFLFGFFQPTESRSIRKHTSLLSTTTLNWIPFHNVSTDCTSWTPLTGNNFSTSVNNGIFTIDGTKAEGIYWAEAAGFETLEKMDSTHSITVEMTGSMTGTGSGWAMELRLADDVKALALASVFDEPTGRNFVDIRPVAGRYVYPLDIGGCGVGTVISENVDLAQPHDYRMTYSERTIGSTIVASVTAIMDNSTPITFDLPWRLNNPNVILLATSRDIGDTVHLTVTRLVARQSYSISGHVTEGGNPLSGVSISVSGGYSTTTDGNGNYILSSLPSGSYTLTPSKSGYTFSPPSRTVSVPPDSTGINFIGTPTTTYFISGRVTDNSGVPLPGVIVSTNSGQSSSSGSNGYYTIEGLSPGTYIIEPSHLDYEFEPLSRSVSVGPSSSGNKFIGFPCLTSTTVNLGDQKNCPLGTPPKLDIPIDYSYLPSFSNALLGSNQQGRVNSWFDHDLPSPYGQKDKYLLPWEGYPRRSGTLAECKLGFSCYDNHEGVDFSKKYSDEKIFAAAPGTVTYVKANCPVGVFDCGNGYGNQVWIDHGYGYGTLYGHLKSVNVSAGDVITESDLRVKHIGIMGKTGFVRGNDGTHLHFGVYHGPKNTQGKWYRQYVIDPYGWWDSETDPWRNGNGKYSTYLWKFPIMSQTPISSSGGSMSSMTNKAKVNFPSGAVTIKTIIQLLDISPVAEASAELIHAGTSFWMRILNGSTGNQPAVADDFNQPVSLQLKYTNNETQHLDVSQLAIYLWDDVGMGWIPLSSVVDTKTQSVFANTSKVGKFDLQGPRLCPQDISEPDDNPNQARVLSPDVNETTSLFDTQNDEDWYRIDTKARAIYVIEATNLAAKVDPKAELYDFGGDELILSDDNGGTGSGFKLKWNTYQDRTYFLRVSQAPGSAYGCSATYGLRILGLKFLDSSTVNATQTP